MRIGIYSDSYKPYTSGVVTSICTFKEELTKLGHEIFIFAPSYPNYHEPEDQVFRFFSVPSPADANFTLAVPVSLRISSAMKKLDLDLVHVHSPFIMGQLGMRCARRFDLPLVFTYHTMYDQYVHYVPLAQELAKELTVKYSTNFCNRCDLIITPSADIKNLIADYGIKTPIEVIPTGVNVEKFGKGDPKWLRENFDIPPGRKICLFVGRLTREKNINFLIKAFGKVHDAYPDTSLVIIATGPLEKELKKLVITEGLALNQDVIFTGFLPLDNLIDAYCGADIFTFASVTETQGIVLVEAMAAGLPVVAVRATGSQEMVQDEVQGILTDYDIDVFALQILRLLKDSQLQAFMAENGVARAAELSSRAMARKLEEHYQLLQEGNHMQRDRKLYSPFKFG